MSQYARSPVTAVLGPTNTGKTHLAVERMCAHSSGMIGFPLRLLAREVYDRVVKLKGESQVALITGEERIAPANARWFLCTAESMPMEHDLAFVGLDEAQLGADPERGHVFTDRLLNARGREETMILGSEALRPMLRSLTPEAEIVTRPRFSTLSYAGAKKLSRLPRRSAIVAFSAEEVYAVAEALRRLRGGAAVVMGALSPRTRNAQVAMFQAGEVDYLVATDAIGMGLNMDVAHVAFASLSKFDGRRQRRLTVAEMAQIAGRAGRHQRDGTFGTLHAEGPGALTSEEVLAIEEHAFPALDHLYWRSGEPDFASVGALIDSLEAPPVSQALRPAPQAVDLMVLKRLADEPWVADRARGAAMVRRLWAACGLPDFRKLGPEPHTRLVSRIFGHLSEGAGHIPHTWFAEEIARLDNVSGDVETIAGRIAAARIWAYVAHRQDWLAEPAIWAERTRALEEKLSDALHVRLTQRFVDRRTAVLMRQIGSDAAALPVTVGPEGEVAVEGEAIGTLSGFRFKVDASARGADTRLLLAAAERHLATELATRAAALAAADDSEFALVTEGEIAIAWQGQQVARLKAGKTPLAPQIVTDRALDALQDIDRTRVRERLASWLSASIARHLKPVAGLEMLAKDADAPAPLRAVAAALADAGGIAPRAPLDPMLAALDSAMRHRLRRTGAAIGTLDIYDARLLKPEPLRWTAALTALRTDRPMPDLAPAGASVADAPAPGFRMIGDQAVRIDLVERIARAAHDAKPGRAAFVPDPSLATSIGIRPGTLERLMRLLGFHAVKEGWAWRGRARRRAEPPRVARPGNAFAALADWGAGG
ncbi:helicase [Sphingomonas gilva]|uniref:Helicase n=1 Tax=Sphingomonas gilva TaxID=2305907 RepID=A0A396RMD7_9SPHN|nr:helicase-related protein [Sphingomonas gilva]RHW17587.1 helicase [Sphingomonas gilva]